MLASASIRPSLSDEILGSVRGCRTAKWFFKALQMFLGIRVIRNILSYRKIFIGVQATRIWADLVFTFNPVLEYKVT